MAAILLLDKNRALAKLLNHDFKTYNKADGTPDMSTVNYINGDHMTYREAKQFGYEVDDGLDTP